MISLLPARGAVLDHRVLENAIRGHDNNDAAAFTLFNFLNHKDPALLKAIDSIDDLHHPSTTAKERGKLDHGAPLHRADLKGRKIRVEFLINKGARVRTKTPKKRLTPLD